MKESSICVVYCQCTSKFVFHLILPRVNQISQDWLTQDLTSSWVMLNHIYLTHISYQSFLNTIYSHNHTGFCSLSTYLQSRFFIHHHHSWTPTPTKPNFRPSNPSAHRPENSPTSKSSLSEISYAMLKIVSKIWRRAMKRSRNTTHEESAFTTYEDGVSTLPITLTIMHNNKSVTREVTACFTEDCNHDFMARSTLEEIFGLDLEWFTQKIIIIGDTQVDSVPYQASFRYKGWLSDMTQLSYNFQVKNLGILISSSI